MTITPSCVVLRFCRDTEDLFKGRRVWRFVNIERVAVRKLQQIHAAMIQPVGDNEDNSAQAVK